MRWIRSHRADAEVVPLADRHYVLEHGRIVATVIADWPLMLLTVATTIVAGGLVGWGLTRLAVLPGTTAAWGSSPGAASAMVAMAEEYGADARLVAFMQYLRVVVVVLTASLVARLILGHPAPTVAQADLPLLPPLLPLLATLAVAGIGAVTGRWLRIPAGTLLVPMTLGAVLQATGTLEITLPPWLLIAAYTALGWYVGLGFDREVTPKTGYYTLTEYDATYTDLGAKVIVGTETLNNNLGQVVAAALAGEHGLRRTGGQLGPHGAIAHEHQPRARMRRVEGGEQAPALHFCVALRCG